MEHLAVVTLRQSLYFSGNSTKINRSFPFSSLMLKAQKTGIWSLRTTSRSSSRVNKTCKEWGREKQGKHSHRHSKSLLSLKDSRRPKPQMPFLIFMSSTASCNAVLLMGTYNNYVVHLLINSNIYQGHVMCNSRCWRSIFKQKR